MRMYKTYSTIWQSRKNQKNKTVNFLKMHGLGNNFVILNHINENKEYNYRDLSLLMTNPVYGVSADGLVIILKSDIADAKMRIFNTDGSEAQMCGNAIRCVAKYLYESNHIDKPTMQIETMSGIKNISLQIKEHVVQSISVDMGYASFSPEDIGLSISSDFIYQHISIDEETIFNGTAVSMGNPHLVILTDNVEDYDFTNNGQKWEHHPLFKYKVNTEFVKLLSKTSIRMRVYERGVGETMACGTGACASVAALTKTGHLPIDTPITVKLNGGELTILCKQDYKIIMTGPATYICKGQFIM